MRNKIVEKYADHKGLTRERIEEIARDISVETGFELNGELQRRTIYDPDKTWRVRLRGTYEGKAASLLIVNMAQKIEEEEIRSAFRGQAAGSHVRPPRTYAHRPFDAARGYAWSIDEDVGGKMLFAPGNPADAAVAAFAPFYRALRDAVTEPFWQNEESDAEELTREQVGKAGTWIKMARDKEPVRIDRLDPLLRRLQKKMLARVKGKPLVFMHPHLAGSDVRVAGDEYIVFANYLWSWRQPGYDIAFPLWGQWLALPEDRRTHENVQAITETWLEMVRRELASYVDVEDVETMLLNRLAGSLLLDVPAQRHEHSLEAVQALEEALIKEAGRLLSTL